MNWYGKKTVFYHRTKTLSYNKHLVLLLWDHSSVWSFSKRKKKVWLASLIVRNLTYEEARLVQAKASNWSVAAGSIKHEVCGYVCFCRSPSSSFLIWIPFTYIWISVKLSLTVDMLPHPVYQTSVFFVTLISQLPVLLNGIMINQSCQFPVLSSVQCNGYLGE